MKRVLRDNGLSIVMFSLFFACLLGQSLAGWRHEVEDRRRHGDAPPTWVEHLESAAFVEATFENWESEFLQMAAFVVLSAVLIQKGAAESKKPPEEEAGRDAKEGGDALAEASPRFGVGIRRALYGRSLSMALAGLFALSFCLHALGGHAQYNEEAAAHHAASKSLLQFVGSSTFWFQSFQNWQSEFLSVGALIVLSIFLRQKGSPESKPVDAPNSQTGS